MLGPAPKVEVHGDWCSHFEVQLRGAARGVLVVVCYTDVGALLGIVADIEEGVLSVGVNPGPNSNAGDDLDAPS